MYCHKCGREILLDERPRREDVCPDCLSYLHCCYNCRLFDERAPNQCHEPMAVPVKEKDLSNACHHFEPSEKKADLRRKQRMDDARKKLDDFFKKS
jgi:hypothetical protein